MKPQLKGIWSPDIPAGDPDLPKDPFNCSIHVCIDIGIHGNDGADEFQCHCETVEFIAGRVASNSYVIGAKTIIVEAFSWQIIKAVINEICESIEGDGWDEIVARLREYFHWEFADYKDNSGQ